MPRLRFLGFLGACALLLAIPAPAAASKPAAAAKPGAARAQAGFSHAYAHDDCAPWDGRAMRIVIQDAPVAPTKGLPAPRYPRYSIALWKPEPALRGAWVTLPDDQGGMGAGHISYEAGPKRFEQVKGRVLIQERSATRIRGELRLALPDGTGRELVYPFSGPWIESRMPCG